MVAGPLETISLAALHEGKVGAGLEVVRPGRSFLLQRELRWLEFRRWLRSVRQVDELEMFASRVGGTAWHVGSRLETGEEQG